MIPGPLVVTLNKTLIRFGVGASRTLAAESLTLGRRIFFLTSRHASGLRSFLDAAQRDVRVRGGDCVHSATIQANPDIADIHASVEAARSCDVIVGIGGGSVLDAAKVLAAVCDSPLTGQEMLDMGARAPITGRRRLILVPTTSGTGSELSYGAIVSDRARRTKNGIRSEHLAPDVAIVDPELTYSVGPELTALTGFDVFTHAFESLVSKRATPFSRFLSMQAITLVGRYLRLAIHAPTNESARVGLSYASMSMGINLAHVGTCLPHRLQYPIGGLMPTTSHPQGLAWIYPVWLKLLYPWKPAEVEQAFGALGLNIPSDARQAADSFRQWLESLGATSILDFKLDIESLVQRISGDLSPDPIPDPHIAAREIYTEMFT